MRLLRALRWLSIRPSWSELGRLFADLFILKVTWSMFVVSAFAAGEYVDELLSNSTEDFQSGIIEALIRDPTLVLCALAAAALLEEVLFRFIPLAAVLLYIKWRPHRALAVFPVMLLSSVAFGLLHAENYGVIELGTVGRALFIQGVGGIMFSVVFLKYAGMRFRYVLGALVASTTAHILWNGFVIAPVVVMTILF